jgi:hypothetical protein
MAITDGSKAGAEDQPDVWQIIGDDDLKEPPVLGLNEPQRPADPQLPRRFSQSPVQRPIETQSSQPTRAGSGPRPKIWWAVGDDLKPPARSPDSPKQQPAPAVAPTVPPFRTPPTNSSSTPGEKTIKTAPVKTNHKPATARGGKPHRSSDPIAAPPGWRHVGGILWKTQDGSPRHQCGRDDKPAGFGMLKLRSRVHCARCGYVLPDIYDKHLSGHFLPADQRLPRPGKRRRRSQKPPTP